MFRFLVMLPIRILFLPILLCLKLILWLCSGLLCMTEWVFGLASGILVVLSILGIPRIAVKLVALTEVMAEFVWEKVY